MDTRPNWKYLVKESALILGLSYALWLGGTYNGLVFRSFRSVSLVGLVVVGALWLIPGRRSGHPAAASLRLPLLALLLAFGLAAALSSDPRRSLISLWMVGLAVWVFWLVSDLLAAGWPAELWVKSLLVAGSVVVVMGVVVIGRWYLSWVAIGGWSEPIPPVIGPVSPS